MLFDHYRFLLGWAMPIKFHLLKFLRTMVEGGADKGAPDLVVQDYIFKIDKLVDAIKFVTKEAEIYPLWLCPARAIYPKELDNLFSIPYKELFVDLGIYGYVIIGI